MQIDAHVITEAWTLVHRCSLLLTQLRELDIEAPEMFAVQTAVWRLCDDLPREPVHARDDECFAEK